MYMKNFTVTINKMSMSMSDFSETNVSEAIIPNGNYNIIPLLDTSFNVDLAGVDEAIFSDGTPRIWNIQKVSDSATNYHITTPNIPGFLGATSPSANSQVLIEASPSRQWQFDILTSNGSGAFNVKIKYALNTSLFMHKAANVIRNGVNVILNPEQSALEFMLKPA